MPLTRAVRTTLLPYLLLLLPAILARGVSFTNALLSSAGAADGAEAKEPFVARGATTDKKKYLRVTALVNNAKNHSALQCWQFTAPFSNSSTPGTAGALSLQVADVTSLAYTVLPPRFNGGLHEAPRPQFVSFISGFANISLPHSPAFAEVRGGANGLIVAVDTMGDGHFTDYPSDQETIGLQLPFKDGKIPQHRVLDHDWPCPKGSQIVEA